MTFASAFLTFGSVLGLAGFAVLLLAVVLTTGADLLGRDLAASVPDDRDVTDLPTGTAAPTGTLAGPVAR